MNKYPEYTNFGSSLENYYHWLRFECFPDEDPKDVAMLLSRAFDANIRKIQTSLHGKSIHKLIKVFSKEQGKIHVKYKPYIIHAYLTEPDRELSYELLRFLLFTDLSKNQLHAWLKRYMKSEPEDRAEMIPKVLYHSKFL